MYPNFGIDILIQDNLSLVLELSFYSFVKVDSH
jgi:hypothetical protein